MPAYWPPGPLLPTAGPPRGGFAPCALPQCHPAAWRASGVPLEHAASREHHRARRASAAYHYPYMPGLVSPRTRSSNYSYSPPFDVFSCLTRTTQEARYATQPPTHRRPLHPYCISRGTTSPRACASNNHASPIHIASRPNHATPRADTTRQQPTGPDVYAPRLWAVRTQPRALSNRRHAVNATTGRREPILQNTMTKECPHGARCCSRPRDAARARNALNRCL